MLLKPRRHGVHGDGTENSPCRLRVLRGEDFLAKTARIFPLVVRSSASRNQIVLLGVFLASFATWRLNCRPAFTAKTQRTPRNPPRKNSLQAAKNFPVSGVAQLG